MSVITPGEAKLQLLRWRQDGVSGDAPTIDEILRAIGPVGLEAPRVKTRMDGIPDDITIKPDQAYMGLRRRALNHDFKQARVHPEPVVININTINKMHKSVLAVLGRLVYATRDVSVVGSKRDRDAFIETYNRLRYFQDGKRIDSETNEPTTYDEKGEKLSEEDAYNATKKHFQWPTLQPEEYSGLIRLFQKVEDAKIRFDRL